MGIYHDRKFGTNKIFFGEFKYPEKTRPFEVGIQVSPEVKKAIELTEPIWSKRSDIPSVVIDKGNHGYGKGLVLLEGTADYTEDPVFVSNEIAVRISFGPKEMEKKNAYTYRKNDRLHISVYGARQFFPERLELPYKSRGSEDIVSELGEGIRETTPIVEEVHISLRWLGDDFDDWNDCEEWFRERYTPLTAEGRKEFSESRTTYCLATPGEIKKDANKELEPEEILKYVESIGKKEQIIPLAPRIVKFANEYGYVNKITDFYPTVGGNRVPIVGYDNIPYKFRDRDGDIRLPDIEESRIKEMSKMEGVEFLFGKVLPALQRFAEI